MTLDVAAARAAVQKVADAMGLETVEEAAEGILAIVNENMAGALRLVSVQRGHDPREFALVAYGGAGPAARERGGEADGLVPGRSSRRRRACSVQSGIWSPTSATSSRRRTSVSWRRQAARRWPTILDDLGGRAREWLEGEGIEEGARRISYVADMRYHRQGYEIPVGLDPDEVRADGLADLEERFNALHEQLYGFRIARYGVRDRQPALGWLRRVPLPSSAPARCPATTRRVPSSTSTTSSSMGRAWHEDLQPREARAGGCDLRPGDRDGVRLDHGHPPRPRGHGGHDLQHPDHPERVGGATSMVVVFPRLRIAVRQNG